MNNYIKPIVHEFSDPSESMRAGEIHAVEDHTDEETIATELTDSCGACCSESQVKVKAKAACCG